MTPRAVLVALLVAASLAPLALAHGAPDPRDPTWETRLLADYNDDCGGDDGAALQQCGGTHDVIALDVREAYDSALGEVVVFRLFLNGAPSAGLRDVVSFKAGGVVKSVELRTDDNVRFTGSGFDAVSQGTAIGDGARFTVEFTLRRSTLADVGSKLTDYKVEAYRGNALGDYMPGTYRTGLGTSGPAPSTEQSQPTKYERAEYALRGPSYLLGLSHDGVDEVPAEGEHIAQVHVTNNLRALPQTITFTVSGGDGAQGLFHNPVNGAYTDTITVDLPKGGQSNVHLAIDGEPGASGTFTVLGATNLGGRTQATVDFRVADATAAPPTEPAPAPAPPGPAGSKGSPGVALPALTLALAAALVVLRRRA